MQDPKYQNALGLQCENAKRTGASLLDCAGMLAPIIVDPLGNLKHFFFSL